MSEEKIYFDLLTENNIIAFFLKEIKFNNIHDFKVLIDKLNKYYYNSEMSKVEINKNIYMKTKLLNNILDDLYEHINPNQEVINDLYKEYMYDFIPYDNIYSINAEINFVCS